ncbi:MAG: LIC_10190 family membrane protein [Acetatifactor sp.]
MAAVLSSWCIIFVASGILGFAFIRITGWECKKQACSLDMILVSGLMIVNLYAQFFSIFYKVGGRACLLLFVTEFVIAGILFYKKELKISAMLCFLKNMSITKILVILVGILTISLWTAQSPQHYDTYLYHAQAIRWIEEYGIVPGLGNLHNRMAYNSAFMPLQALFSLRWLTGQSYHSVNGFVCCAVLIYAMTSNHLVKGENIQTSDLFKAAAIGYVLINRQTISSPCSDTLAMLLVLYISIKWCEFSEQGVKKWEPYMLLGLFGIWAVTVKLSTAVCALFAFLPFIMLIRDKKWEKAAENILLGLLIVLPWLVRNIIISGYLLYPYAQLDFFDVDWKMPSSVLECDSTEIMVWGRELKDISLCNVSFFEWFPNWFEAQNPFYRVLVVLGLLSAFFVFILLLCQIVKKGYLLQNILLLFTVTGLLVWLLTAPLMRYGIVYLMLPICILVERLLSRKYNNILKLIMLFVLIPALGSGLIIWKNIDIEIAFNQEDYLWKETEEIEWNGIRMYIPVESDQCGYYAFPSTPYSTVLELIEMRGETLDDGFRAKKDYFEKRLNNSGREW